MHKIFSSLNGPQTLGKGPVFWGLFLLFVSAAAGIPVFTDAFTVTNISYFLVWVFMTMGLSLM